MFARVEAAVGRAAFSGSLRHGSHLAAFSFIMQLLYLDDAGSVKNRNEKHFILAGIAIFERQVHWLQTELDELAKSTGHPEPDRLEFHGNAISAGRGWWRRVPRDERRAVIKQGLLAAQNLVGPWRLFGVVVDKRERSPEDPVEYAFEQLSSRFDLFLKRLYRQGDNQRGLIILDKASQETRLQTLALEFKNVGHRWGVTHNLVDVPLFVDSRATRIIQYADLVAYAIWRKFEKGDGEFFDVIADSFDSEGGVVHGLHHFKRLDDFCDCPACVPTFR